MREMKDSGIEWIGEIPQNWNISPLFCYFTEGRKPNIGLMNDNLLSLSYGNIIRKDINTKDGLLPANFESYNIVQKHHIIVRTLDLQNDKKSLRTGLVKEESGIITSAYLDLVPKQYTYSPYYYYLLHVYDLIKVFYNMGNGVRQSLNFKEFSKLPLISPTDYEQKKISDYLDSKCSKIDSIIEKQKQIIEKLKGYKTSLITEVVTKGLDPNAKMKDSGVEWIGKIPRDWSVECLKYIYNKANVGESIDKDYTTDDDNDYVFYTAGLKPIHTKYCDFPRDKYTKEHDLLLARNGTPYVYLPNNNSVYSDHIIRISIENNVDRRFVRYSLQQAIESLKVEVVSIATWSISLWKKQKLPLPQLVVQQRIADYLDSKCSQIDTSIIKKEQIIEKLQEYKKSLIYEVVTGKREV